MKSQLASFIKTFDVRFPIIQSPMAGASTVELAAAITNSGGLGSIPVGANSEDPKKIETLFFKFQSLVHDEKLKRNVNLNFFTHEPPRLNREPIHSEWLQKYESYYKIEDIEFPESGTKLLCPYPTFKSILNDDHETIKTLIRLKPKIVSFHFGLPNIQVMKSLQEAGIKIFITVTNLAEFKQIVEIGADGVVLQGWEAGGHRGNFKANDVEDEQLSTEELVEAIVDYIDSDYKQFKFGCEAPLIIAAGGLYNGETISTVLNYGIAGVQLGTVWLPTKQAFISQEHKRFFYEQSPTETIMTPAVSGRNLRTIETDYLTHLTNDSPLETIPDYPLPYSIFKNFASDSRKAGAGPTYSAFLAGSNYHESTRDTDDAYEIFRQIIDELDSQGYHFKRCFHV